MSGVDVVELMPECESARKRRIRSIRITQGLGLVFALGFSSVITGIYPYLKEVIVDTLYLRNIKRKLIKFHLDD